MPSNDVESWASDRSWLTLDLLHSEASVSKGFSASTCQNICITRLRGSRSSARSGVDSSKSRFLLGYPAAQRCLSLSICFDIKWFRKAAGKLGIKEVRHIIGFHFRPFLLFIGNIRVTYRVGK